MDAGKMRLPTKDAALKPRPSACAISLTPELMNHAGICIAAPRSPLGCCCRLAAVLLVLLGGATGARGLGGTAA